ncbi:hypothetical protein A9Q74_05235 [Colwellia sp. 39_35_sub15_T18]|nr:hypothetical protein A9Q74_05235 [Colwellia sp. 39_35_sub15_T18]
MVLNKKIGAVIMILRYLLLYISLYSVDVIATSQTIEIYSWKDKSEEIHYSQFPPEDKVKSFEITIEQMPLPILKDEKLKNWSIEIDKYITEKKNLRKNQKQQVKMKKRYKENCEIAQKNLILYKSHQRVRIRSDDTQGAYVMPEKERLKEIKLAEKSIKSYC